MVSLQYDFCLLFFFPLCLLGGVLLWQELGGSFPVVGFWGSGDLYNVKHVGPLLWQTVYPGVHESTRNNLSDCLVSWWIKKMENKHYEIVTLPFFPSLSYSCCLVFVASGALFLRQTAIMDDMSRPPYITAASSLQYPSLPVHAPSWKSDTHLHLHPPPHLSLERLKPRRHPYGTFCL